ncbi:hypothetical protein E3N88_23949 [Mikania micrantha]|uniref:Uncharacterized protein n=1 Tax=Mikania micrantha TaxID=192012 RepID=A0A5N6NHD8_9ASTR|nr:hypothetical protein E3N88_23949 [Mikania micrantha]
MSEQEQNMVHHLTEQHMEPRNILSSLKKQNPDNVSIRRDFSQGTVACTKRDRLLKKSMGQQKAIDYDLLTQIGARERITAIIGEDTPWTRLFEICYAPQYRLITVEFLSTFNCRPVDPDFQPQPDQPQPPEEIHFDFAESPHPAAGTHAAAAARAHAAAIANPAAAG